MVDLDWFRSSHRVIALRLFFLYYDMKFDTPNRLQIMGCYLYNQENCLIDTIDF
jgi:hypothetical protein